MDSIKADGEVSIHYVAQLSIGPWFTLRWASSFLSKPDHTMQERQWWRRIVEPSFIRDAWHWISPSGQPFLWRPMQSTPGLVLHEDTHARIAWTCHAPLATSESTGSCQGEGYVEQIAIHLTRAKLPFRKLWWGRSHVDNDSLVWIRWSDGIERTWILRNGTLVDGQMTSDSNGCVNIILPGEIWRVQQERILRHRDLRQQLPKLIVMLTGSLPLASEHKFLGTVHLERPQQPSLQGHTIGEIVQWK